MWLPSAALRSGDKDAMLFSRRQASTILSFNWDMAFFPLLNCSLTAFCSSLSFSLSNFSCVFFNLFSFISFDSFLPLPPRRDLFLFPFLFFLLLSFSSLSPLPSSLLSLPPSDPLLVFLRFLSFLSPEPFLRLLKPNSDSELESSSMAANKSSTTVSVDSLYPSESHTRNCRIFSRMRLGMGLVQFRVVEFCITYAISHLIRIVFS